jgi:hypothetical protein
MLRKMRAITQAGLEKNDICDEHRAPIDETGRTSLWWRGILWMPAATISAAVDRGVLHSVVTALG